jgi:hypothetical protein
VDPVVDGIARVRAMQHAQRANVSH